MRAARLFPGCAAPLHSVDLAAAPDRGHQRVGPILQAAGAADGSAAAGQVRCAGVQAPGSPAWLGYRPDLECFTSWPIPGAPS